MTLFCGKMGAGKSTLARAIAAERGAVLLSEDDWLAAHYGAQIQTLADYARCAETIKPVVADLVMQILRAGTSVVMDFPANSVTQRAWLRGLADAVGASHELHDLRTSDRQCLAHIAQRRSEQPARARFDTPEMFHRVSQHFEPPTRDEGLQLIVVVEEEPG